MDVVKYLQKEKNINFTKEQIEVVKNINGPSLALAVPGAGKTTSLVARTANMVLYHNIKPESILTITFSKPSSLDMKKRFNDLFGDFIEVEEVTFSTIHSFAYRIISNTHKEKRLIDIPKSPTTKVAMIKSIYQKIRKEHIEEDKLEEVSTAISYVKNKMIDLNKLSNEELQKICNFKDFKNIYLTYERDKDKENYIDFDDMLTLCYIDLRSNHKLLNVLRDKFKYIQVDEAQDTSTIQFAITELLASPRNNIFYMGDVNQGIMSFRASDIKYLLNFKSKYPNGKIYTMSRNFRSTKDIVDTANNFIKTNKERYEFDMYTEKENYRPITTIYTDTESEGLNYIIKDLQNRSNYEESAVLFRNNMSCITVVDSLSKANVPFYVRDHDNRFFSHWIIYDILSFINLAYDSHDYKSLKRIYYKTILYVKKEIIDGIENKKNQKGCLDALIRAQGLTANQTDNIYDFMIYLNKLKEANGREIVRLIREDMGYGDYINRSAEKMGYSKDALLGLLDVFEKVIEDCQSAFNVKEKLDYLNNLIKESSKNKNENVVTLSTIHGSKGLEWENVYILDLIDGIFPSNQANKLESDEGDSSMMEEERRLCYVAITRGKRHVDVVIPRTKGRNEVYPSIFVGEIKRSTTDKIDGQHSVEVNLRGKKAFEVGDTVYHNKFGSGFVVEIKKEMDYLTVNFSSYGIKKIVLSLAEEGVLVKESRI